MTAPRHALMVLTLAAAMMAPPALAQRRPASVDPAKASTIRRLLELTGAAPDENRHPYMKVEFAFTPALGHSHDTHILDSHTGTHLVPPAYALPPKGALATHLEPHFALLHYRERPAGPGVSGVVSVCALAQKKPSQRSERPGEAIRGKDSSRLQ